MSTQQKLDFARDFLSEEEHRTIRTLTQILSWTQRLAEGGKAHVNFSASICSEAAEAQQNSQHKLLNSCLRSVDGGGSEAIAILPGGFTGRGLTLFAGGAQRSLEGNVQTDLREPTVSKGERCRVGFTRYTVPPDFVQDPLPSLLDLLGKHGGDVPPALTVQLTLTLLKHAPRQIGQEAQHKAWEDFTVFMTCVGRKRLQERFDFGARARNFYAVFRLRYEDEDEEIPASFAEAVDKLTGPQANEERFNGVAPLPKGNKPELKTFLRKLELISKADHKQSESSEYNAPRFFYGALCTLLRGIEKALNRAKLCQPPWAGQASDDRAAFSKAIHALEGIMRFLWAFVARFREQIRLTLKWVARICELKDDAHPGSEPGIEQASPHLEGEHFVTLKEIEDGCTWDWSNACLQWLQLLLSQQDAARDIHMWAPSRTWRSKSLRQVVPLAKVHTIEFRVAPWDRGSRDLCNVRQELEELVWRSETSRRALTMWLERNGHGDLDEAEFTGAVHCETMLLTLHALTLPWVFGCAYPSPETISQCLRSRDIVVCPQVIGKLQAGRDMLGVSRRCCPGCRAVVLAIRNLQSFRRRVTPPPFHGVWLPMALPPWTPRRIGLKLLVQLRHEIRYRGRLAFKALTPEEQEELNRNHVPEVIFPSEIPELPVDWRSSESDSESEPEA
ncbi:hypothetical protein AYO21_08836 [Fonsecaea monophora]|uniref:Uncharacterized protein n=1 Tax=Fonsecaea monophora TaxID=254056 RepID=A0A177EY60_9EURO|nr:hypothetical protein AYO21_08836 [Fonsecaea monophora]KAH0837033.1 hypothetical protein FOPE_04593 [Fonsecaea pedrosoi]OAG36983.1 hypothetical protein AYO21_08836 [Fonsecaea monophora]